MKEPELQSAPVAPPITHTINGEQLVSAKESARYLGVSYATILNLAKYHNRLETRKIESTLWVTADSLLAEQERRNAVARVATNEASASEVAA